MRDGSGKTEFSGVFLHFRDFSMSSRFISSLENSSLVLSLTRSQNLPSGANPLRKRGKTQVD
jgi:hypothetical protein